MHCLQYAVEVNLYVNNNHLKGKIDIQIIKSVCLHILILSLFYFILFYFLGQLLFPKNAGQWDNYNANERLTES